MRWRRNVREYIQACMVLTDFLMIVSCLRMNSIQVDFPRFINVMISDTTFLLDESIKCELF